MAPTIVITIEITAAKIGRSIKNRENTGRAVSERDVVGESSRQTAGLAILTVSDHECHNPQQ
jgi:hypothetical protein